MSDAYESSETIGVEKQGSILAVTIKRVSKGNSLSPVEHELLHNTWTRFETDSSVRVGLLCAEGDRIFCSGNDLGYASYGKGFAIPTTGLGGLTSNFAREKPIIAVINGAAVGGGFEIAIACDLVVAATHATFGLPEVKAGTYAGAGGLTRLPGLIGDKLATEMILTGQAISAERAYELGLVNRVVEKESLIAEAERLAGLIIANSPVASAISKRIMNQTRNMTDLAEAQKISDRWGKEVIGSKDFKEGVSAFLEKRKPEWLGE